MIIKKQKLRFHILKNNKTGLLLTTVIQITLMDPQLHLAAANTAPSK
jgi:hypothetical protein